MGRSALLELEQAAAGTLRDYEPATRATVRDFAATLRPDQLAAFWEVIIAVDWAAADVRQAEMQDQLDRALAHFEGVAKAFRVVYEHLNNESVPSCTGNDGKCMLPPLPE